MTAGRGNYPAGVGDSDFDDSSDQDLYIEIELAEGDVAQLRRHTFLNTALLDRRSRAVLENVFYQITGAERERT